MPAEVIDHVHAIAKKAPKDLTFGDRNNNPMPATIPFVDIGPWSNADDSATPPDEDSVTDSAYIPSNDDDDDSDSGSSGPAVEDNASDSAGVSESEEEDDPETPGDMV